MSRLMAEICADLQAEAAELKGLLRDLSERRWELPTPAEGWSIKDQIAHLAFYDEKAVLALQDPDAFTAEVSSLAERSIDTLEEEHLRRGRAMAGNEVLGWWDEARDRLVSTYSGLEPKDRVVWYGPPMAVRTKVTARIMETWAHGQDVRDALGVAEIPDGRLRHICHLSVRARPYAFLVNGLVPPGVDVRVELTAPDGSVWAWGDEGAADRVTGPALDFALLATRRRNRADLSLETRGETADRWLDIAQAFAGPPGSGREPGRFDR